MKKNLIVAIALALGVLSVGAVSASAASSCCNEGKHAGMQNMQQFSQETAGLSSQLKAKDIELREQYGFDGMDTNKVSNLEADLKELKGQIKVIAEKYSIQPCCLG
jgi:peptidoglycan hydrolase CwlO-like protein